MIQPRTPRRRELGEFLGARRKATSRGSLGLPPSPRRGDVGLSREEVAALAGVSASWYTWLEQGRDINVSQQVVSAVARVLRLTPDESAYVLSLTQSHSEPPVPRDEAPAHLQHLVDALDFPAFILTTDWAILGWNAAYEWLYPRISSLDASDRNLLWLVYTDPQLRRMLPDWEQDSRRFLAEFRAEAGVRLAGPPHRAIVDRLREASRDFPQHWSELGVARFESRRRQFRHRTTGLVEFEHHRLVPSDAVDLHVVMYVPVGATAHSTS
ncbi:MAG: helix-turn-helix transcriptional regulator [Candidatus Microbacterium stercoravium]|uniref:Helix-turn-helix transcriptional regulator n=1 Tax=Candidatus Microbacterium stercoravium TaxID=2838697 RepID=A0A9D2H3P5_9MICO|nr:helix-turn-helix transcriptional regulator [Candidatus Microbacterium stercoravium]